MTALRMLLADDQDLVPDGFRRGRTKAELASALGISETTVRTRVARILAKLDLRDGVQIAIFAYRHGLETEA